MNIGEPIDFSASNVYGGVSTFPRCQGKERSATLDSNKPDPLSSWEIRGVYQGFSPLSPLRSHARWSVHVVYGALGRNSWWPDEHFADSYLRGRHLDTRQHYFLLNILVIIVDPLSLG